MANAHDTPVWHLATDREQLGPLSAAEVRERFLAGELGERPDVWREGLENWLPLNAVSGFEDLVISVHPDRRRGADVACHFDCLQRIAGSVWSEAEDLGDYLAKQGVEDVGENTAMVDIRRISRSYDIPSESPSIAVGSGDELPMVANPLFVRPTQVAWSSINSGLVVLATVMTITTLALAIMLAL